MLVYALSWSVCAAQAPALLVTMHLTSEMG